MKKFVTLFVFFLSLSVTVGAQTFTEHVQQKQNGIGSVTVTHSKAIDQLVNGTAQVESSVKPKATELNRGSEKKSEQQYPSTIRKDKETVVNHAETERKTLAERKEETKAETERKTTERSSASRNSEEEMNIPTVDMRKKVMRGSHKVTGYRVQAYAGGNSRADKVKAQKIGNAIKMKYPDVPIYVHFYSPRWICRVGNYRSYEQARQMLNKVRAMGYRGATIVRGKITVQY